MTVYRSDLFTIFLKDLMDCWQQRLSGGVRWSITNSVELSDRFATVSGRSPRTKVSTEILRSQQLVGKNRYVQLSACAVASFRAGRLGVK